MVNSPLIRPAIYWRGSFGGGTLDIHESFCQDLLVSMNFAWSFQWLEISGSFGCLPSFGRKRPQNPANQETQKNDRKNPQNAQKPSKRPQKHARNRKKNKTPKTLKKTQRLLFFWSWKLEVNIFLLKFYWKFPHFSKKRWFSSQFQGATGSRVGNPSFPPFYAQLNTTNQRPLWRNETGLPVEEL